MCSDLSLSQVRVAIHSLQVIFLDIVYFDLEENNIWIEFQDLQYSKPKPKLPCYIISMS